VFVFVAAILAQLTRSVKSYNSAMTATLRSICVFCGSSVGNWPEYAAAAAEFGRLLAEKRIRVVYGAGNVGLMGVLADAALAAGGEVIGVIPQMLVDRELARHRITDLRIVGSMHERKALMAELSDAFVALPGGLGTYEELCEVLTWAQLGIHHKPCGCLNVLHYFTPLERLLANAVAEGFMRPEHRGILLSSNDPHDLIARLSQHQPPFPEKWTGREVI
jgi:uncharacterized protein (TIGR00730 family)